MNREIVLGVLNILIHCAIWFAVYMKNKRGCTWEYFATVILVLLSHVVEGCYYVQ